MIATVRLASRVAHVHAPELVLRSPDRRIGHRPVRRTELRARNAGDARTSALGRVEIEALVEVHAHAEPRLVDHRRSAAATRRRTRPSRHRCSRTRPSHRASSPRRRRARRRRRGTRRRTSRPMRSMPARLQRRRSGAAWRCSRDAVRRFGPVRRGDGVNGTSRTHSDTDDLLTPSAVGDVEEREAVGAHRARPFLFLHLAAVAHGPTVRRGCDGYERVVTPSRRAQSR